jgi:hypothetical protein
MPNRAFIGIVASKAATTVCEPDCKGRQSEDGSAKIKSRVFETAMTRQRQRSFHPAGNPLWRTVVTSTILLLVGWSVVAQQSSVALPMVASAQVPLYPPVARRANVEGVVHLKITTDGHRVVSTQVEDGHKLLAAAAEENARTWQFSLHEPTTFTVTYSYKLLTRWKGDPNNPAVVLRFPTEVEVSTMRWRGTVDMPAEVK